jgi:large subunit ribosomal protein L5
MAHFTSVKEKIAKAYDSMKADFGYKNKMQATKIQKVIVSVGVGSQKDKKKIELIESRLQKITGQKPAARVAKKSIATFKVREGDLSGYQVTLRGPRMIDFLDRLINVSIPRTKDFRGISRKGVDEMGNYTLGIKEHTIFPETADEDIKDVFGMSVIIVTNVKDTKETLTFLETIGFPFKKA